MNAIARIGLALATGLAAAHAPAPHADDGGANKPPPSPFETPPPNAAQQELLELFGKVERKLREIDATLWDASTGDTALSKPEDAGIADLLRRARSDGREVQEGIARILEIAQQNGGGGGGGGQSPPPSQPDGKGRDPGDPSQRERTPEAPEPEGEQPKQPEGEDPHQPDPGGEEPDQDENQVGPMRREETGQRSNPGDDAERWGELPQRVRELFRTEGGGDMPARYRDWIDAYYKRLNRAP